MTQVLMIEDPIHSVEDVSSIEKDTAQCHQLDEFEEELMEQAVFGWPAASEPGQFEADNVFIALGNYTYTTLISRNISSMWARMWSRLPPSPLQTPLLQSRIAAGAGHLAFQASYPIQLKASHLHPLGFNFEAVEETEENLFEKRNLVLDALDELGEGADDSALLAQLKRYNAQIDDMRRTEFEKAQLESQDHLISQLSETNAEILRVVTGIMNRLNAADGKVDKTV